MINSVPVEIVAQPSQSCDVIERHPEPTLLAVHLYSSALDGGLKPYSYIDPLVTMVVLLDETCGKPYSATF